MPVKKQHSDHSPCPLAQSLDLVGDHWTLLVIRDLMVTHRHEFKDIINGPEGISTNVLTDRLQALRNAGLIDYCAHPENGRRKIYFLTREGKGLVYLLASMRQWGMERSSPGNGPVLGKANKIEKRATEVMEALTKWETENLPKSLLSALEIHPE